MQPEGTGRSGAGGGAVASPATDLATSRILVVDDNALNLRLIERILGGAGYSRIACLSEPRQVRPLCERVLPDLILLDLHMPGLDGFGVMEQLAPITPPDDYLPILVVTADVTRETRERALRMGAKDFLTKPVDATEVVLRVGNLLQTRHLYRNLRTLNAELERRVAQRTAQLERAHDELLERLALAADYRDDITGAHSRRVAAGSARIGSMLGMPDREARLLQQAAVLHDFGKIAIPDSVLLKPGSLTDDEFALMRSHTTIGASLLAGSQFPTLALGQELARMHHERWDGRGYLGLAGDSVPLSSRIVAVADVFDALIHVRPYKKAWPLSEAVAAIASGGGTQFDPEVVAAFMADDLDGYVGQTEGMEWTPGENAA